MIIVNDLQDAANLRRKLSYIIKRHSMNVDASPVLQELAFIVEDLDANIERIDNENFIENN
mgnify:CR=1 FL=1|jgi:hypothetical protein